MRCRKSLLKPRKRGGNLSEENVEGYMRRELQIGKRGEGSNLHLKGSPCFGKRVGVI